MTDAKRPCCRNCSYWGTRPYSIQECHATFDMYVDDPFYSATLRTPAHFLCIVYQPRFEDLSPARPELFALEPDDGASKEYHAELSAEWVEQLIKIQQRKLD